MIKIQSSPPVQHLKFIYDDIEMFENFSFSLFSNNYLC